MTIEPMYLCGFWLYKVCEKSDKIRVSWNDFSLHNPYYVDEIISVAQQNMLAIMK